MSISFEWEGQSFRLQATERRWLSLQGYEREALFDQLASPQQAIGWLPGRDGLLVNLRVWENLVLSSGYHGRALDHALDARVRDLLLALDYEEAELPSLLGSPVARLSAKQIARLCAARCLICRPSLILLESEWLLHWSEQEAAQLHALFERYIPGACWLVLGTAVPAAVWQIAPLGKENHVASR